MCHVPCPGCASCSETMLLWEPLAPHRSLTAGIKIKVSFTLFEYSKNFPLVQSVLMALQCVQRANRTHTAFYLSDISSPTLSLKLPITAVQFCPSRFFLYLGEGGRRWGRQRIDGLIAPKMDFSLLLGSNNKRRKFYILKACLLASASPETKKMLPFR